MGRPGGSASLSARIAAFILDAGRGSGCRSILLGCRGLPPSRDVCLEILALDFDRNCNLGPRHNLLPEVRSRPSSRARTQGKDPSRIPQGNRGFLPGSNPGVPAKQNPAKTNLPKPKPPDLRAFCEVRRDSLLPPCWVLLGFFRVRIRTQVRTRTHARGLHPIPGMRAEKARRPSRAGGRGAARHPGGLRPLGDGKYLPGHDGSGRASGPNAPPSLEKPPMGCVGSLSESPARCGSSISLGESHQASRARRP